MDSTQDQQKVENFDVEEAFEFVNKGSPNKEDNEFDEVVGDLQDIILTPEFDRQHKAFFEKNITTIEAQGENNPESISIFKEYQEKVQSYIIKKLTQARPNFDMDKFLDLIKSRQEEIDPQLMEILSSFIDFETFRQHLLEEKRLQERALEEDLSNLRVSGYSIPIHSSKEFEKKKEKEGKSIKKDELEDKENQSIHQNLTIEKEGDFTKATQKKGTNSESNLKQGENIVS